MSTLDPPNWQPALADVAAHIIARTLQTNGQIAATFNQSTKPTDSQVQRIVDQAVSLLRPRLGPVPERLVDDALALCALRAAYMVERSYFPEQVADGSSPYNALRGEFKDALCEWDKAATGDEPNGTHFTSIPVGTLYPGYATGTF